MSSKLTIELMQQIAHDRGGECLSGAYVNAHTKLLWRCAEGHEWEARPHNIKNSDSWCPICAGHEKLTIELMQQIAQERGGECLSEEYSSNKTKLRWRCAEGHEWKAKPCNIKNRKGWCPACAEREKLTIELMQQIAQERGGKCLSEEYSSNRTELLWRCAEGHEWRANPNSIKNAKSWCPQCSHTVKPTIEMMREIAQGHEGECLSDEYVNAHTKLLWQCSQGHKWWAMPASIKNSNTWCPHCRYKNEQECRDVFEALTGQDFAKCKPKWLEGLELDGYCEELGIAFEYNGEQHYRVVPAWHKEGEDDLEEQKARDAKKARLCEDNWAVLIVISFDVKDKDVFIGRALADIFG